MNVKLTKSFTIKYKIKINVSSSIPLVNYQNLILETISRYYFLKKYNS